MKIIKLATEQANQDYHTQRISITNPFRQGVVVRAITPYTLGSQPRTAKSHPLKSVIEELDGFQRRARRANRTLDGPVGRELSPVTLQMYLWLDVEDELSDESTDWSDDENW